MVSKKHKPTWYLPLIFSALLCIFGVIGYSMLTGIFVPFQTSELTALGICTQMDIYDPQTQISGPQEELFICGIIKGDSKRSISFSLFYNGNREFYQSGNWKPGEFFIAIDASQLNYIDSAVFPPGRYRIEGAYGREPFTTFEFMIENAN